MTRRLRHTRRVERLALLGSLLALFGELHPLFDLWVNAAKAVSTFLGVSLSRGIRRARSARDSVRVSRLAGVDIAPRNALSGVTA
ncbi:hypothetical protein [Kitasatospora sp. GP82]|uniref:hypothetical protein n=1 Tax=Kitasatospora sp. GP82 TaxID=3035089 RepID=UPI002476920E|nr:hypothetical protein [Kitasatospora sp. GP82]MDH6129392.1 hypothetical protein [Kitasatospora sp. GP82]